jgi:stress response protein YsnF
MESSTYSRVTDWNDVIKKEVRGLNDADLGEVQEVNETIVVTEKGSINKEKFYLPKSITHGYNGRTLLFDITEEEAKGKFMTEPTTTTEAATSPSSTEEGAKLSTVDTENTEKSIPVIEERLEISKKESIEEAKVIKEPSKETRTVEVELVHEELIIERKAVQLDKASTTTTTTTTTPTTTSSSEEIMQSKTEINIPLMREDVVVSKKPYVKEEIVIKKKPVTETKTVTEQVTSERVKVKGQAGEEVVEDEVKKK